MGETLREVEFESPLPRITVRAEVAAGEVLPHRPAWDIVDVRAAPARTSEEARTLDAETTGSDRLTGDELRFDVKTGLLRSASFKVPDERGAPAEHASWLDVPITRGALRLVGRAPFTLDATDARVFDRDGRFLLGALAHPATAEGRMRLPIAEGLDLLFEGPRYRGWILTDPLDRIDVPPGAPRPPRPAPRTIALYFAYYERLDMDAIDAIMDREEAICAELRRIGEEAAEVAASVDGRAAPLVRAIHQWLR